MSTDTQAYPPDAGAQPFLLTVRGTITAPSVAEARDVHNATAGAPPSVAAARSLGDLSHNVYASLGSSREILFIDVWNSLSGLGQFFANPQVQQAAGQLFADRDATVWSVADGFGNVHLAAPAGRRVTGVGILRTRVTSLEKAALAYSAYVGATINLARASGLVTHASWIRVPDPGAELTPEVISIDTWLDVDAMNAYYAGSHGFDQLGTVFAGTPDTTVWSTAPGDWTEW